MATVICVSAIAESAALSTPTNQVIVAAKVNASGGSSTVSITLPSDVKRSTIHAMLNGKDISSRLRATDCAQGTCLTGTVSSGDGLRMGKNVVYATAHTEQGRPGDGARTLPAERNAAGIRGTEVVRQRPARER